MSPRMSCSLTVDAVRARTKFVTRRAADTWKNLKPGDRVTLVEKAMGLPKGARQVVLTDVEIVDVRVEPISAMTEADIVLEGVGIGWRLQAWIDWWKLEHGFGPGDDPDVRRIEWRYLDEPGDIDPKILRPDVTP